MTPIWHDRRQADAAIAAACADIGQAPDERHEEAGGTAFWWTSSTPAWPNGVIVFWRHGRDWRYVPLDSDENPIRGGAERLLWAADLPAGEVAQRVFALLTDGPEANPRESNLAAQTEAGE